MPLSCACESGMHASFEFGRNLEDQVRSLQPKSVRRASQVQDVNWNAATILQ